MNQAYDSIRAVRWHDDGRLELLDQRHLPFVHQYLPLTTVTEVINAIADMVVRGAPAIGIAAAYGVVLAASQRFMAAPKTWREDIVEDLARLAAARPTAVNLAWAVNRMQPFLSPEVIDAHQDPSEILLKEARLIHEEDIAANHQMGALGAALFGQNARVLTHCNAGALATGGYGTALGVIRSGWSLGKIAQIYADETRPWLQGTRLTAWELAQDNIPVTVLVEGAAGALMKTQAIEWVIVGADRIAANGDVANKIGTYNLAVLARYHEAKLMVVAPVSTIDMHTNTGEAIPIEIRAQAEIFKQGDRQIMINEVNAWNPAFDVTPAELVDVIVTNLGIVEQPNAQKMSALMSELGPSVA